MNLQVISRVASRYLQKVSITFGRVWLEKGKLIKVLTPEAQLGRYYSGDLSRLDLVLSLEFQTYKEDGSKSNMNYKGEATFDKNFVTIGDPVLKANLDQLRIDENPTKESEDKLDHTLEGAAAAFDLTQPEISKGLHRQLRKKNSNEYWLEGFDAVMKFRKIKVR
jgi:hypothetical protein